MTSIRQRNQSGSKCLVKVGTISTWAKEAAAKREEGMEVKLTDSLRAQGMKGRNQGPHNFSSVGSQFSMSSEEKTGGEKHSEEEAEKHSGHVDFETA